MTQHMTAVSRPTSYISEICELNSMTQKEVTARVRMEKRTALIEYKPRQCARKIRVPEKRRGW